MFRYFISIVSFSLTSIYLLYWQNLSPSSKYSLKSFTSLVRMIPSLPKHHFTWITYIYVLTTTLDPFKNQNVLFKNCIGPTILGLETLVFLSAISTFSLQNFCGHALLKLGFFRLMVFYKSNAILKNAIYV